MMTKWLPKTNSKIPKFCKTFVSARSVVLDAKKEEILLIKERYESPENHHWVNSFF